MTTATAPRKESCGAWADRGRAEVMSAPRSTRRRKGRAIVSPRRPHPEHREQGEARGPERAAHGARHLALRLGCAVRRTEAAAELVRRDAEAREPREHDPEQQSRVALLDQHARG